MVDRPSPRARRGHERTPSPPSEDLEQVKLAHANEIKALKAVHAEELEGRDRDAKAALRRAKEELRAQSIDAYDELGQKAQEIEELQTQLAKMKTDLSRLHQLEASIQYTEEAAEQAQQAEAKAIKDTRELKARHEELYRDLKAAERNASTEVRQAQQAAERAAEAAQRSESRCEHLQRKLKAADGAVAEAKAQLESLSPSADFRREMAELRDQLALVKHDRADEDKEAVKIKTRCAKLEEMVSDQKYQLDKKEDVIVELRAKVREKEASLQEVRCSGVSPGAATKPLTSDQQRQAARTTSRFFWVASIMGFLGGLILGGLFCAFCIRCYFVTFGHSELGHSEPSLWSSLPNKPSTVRQWPGWFWYYALGYQPDWAAKLAWDLSEWRAGIDWWPILTDDYTAPYLLSPILNRGY